MESLALIKVPSVLAKKNRGRVERELVEKHPFIGRSKEHISSTVFSTSTDPLAAHSHTLTEPAEEKGN